MSIITTSIDLSRSAGGRVFVKHPGALVQQFSSSSTCKCQQGFRSNRALLSLIRSQPCRNKIVCSSSTSPGDQSPSVGHSNFWRGCMIGMVFSVIIPFWRHKWGPLLQLKKEVDIIVDNVEAVVEVVEKVAEKVEEVADEIGDHLPADGKLRAAAELVESIAREAAKDAHLADQLIEKTEALEDQVEDLFESALSKAGHAIKDVGDESNVQVATEKKIQ